MAKVKRRSRQTERGAEELIQTTRTRIKSISRKLKQARALEETIQDKRFKEQQRIKQVIKRREEKRGRNLDSKTTC